MFSIGNCCGGFTQPGNHPSFSGKTVTLKNRVCDVCQLLPPLFVLASSVLGIALALIWNRPYLTIAFALGAAASVYLMVLSCCARKDYESAEILRTENANLKKERILLHGSVETFQKENVNLQNAISNLQTERENWEKERFHFMQEANSHVDNLNELVGALATERAAAVEKNNQFRTQIDKLELMIPALEKRANNNDNLHRNQLQAYGELLRTLKALLSTANLQEQIKELQTLHSMNDELQKKQCTMLLEQQKIASLSDQYQNQINALKEQKTALTVEVHNLKEITDTNKEVLAQLQKLIQEALQILAKLPELSNLCEFLKNFQAKIIDAAKNG